MSVSAVGQDLSSLLLAGSPQETPVKAVPGYNLGNMTLQLTLPMYDVYRMSQVANERDVHGEAIAQRKLDPAHARRLAIYILRGLVSAAVKDRQRERDSVSTAYSTIQERLGEQPYLALQPIVANLRSVGRNGEGLQAVPIDHNGERVILKAWLRQQDLLWIVDGQHRRKGMDLVFHFLEDVVSTHRYPKKQQSLYVAESADVSEEDLQVWQHCLTLARTTCTVTIDVHLGLEIEEERQLFHDLNNLGKKVENSLSLEFDSGNPVNAFIKEKLVGTGTLRVVTQDVVNWSEDTGALSRKDIVVVNAHLFLNKSNTNGALPPVVLDREPIAMRFWEAVTAIPGFGESQAKQKTVAAQPVVLKALAKLTYDFAFGRQANPELLDTLLDGISDIDFSHENPMWRYYGMGDQERLDTGLVGLADYLPSIETGNRDIGKFDNGVMRFGAKHNDIFPIIGDMIRWKLGLPNRHGN